MNNNLIEHTANIKSTAVFSKDNKKPASCGFFVYLPMEFFCSKTMDFVNKKAFEGTLLAHTDGGVPNLVIKLKDMKEETCGQLVYFFEKACAISGYILGVNPFDQPGVESYKKNMFALLGKPGYEALAAELLSRID